MLISGLSERTSVSTRALRHYDRRGLLPSVRLSNRYRDFPETAVERVRRIRLFLDVGLDLDSAENLLPCFAADGRPTPCQAARERLLAQIQSVDAALATMGEARRLLVAALVQWEDNPSIGTVEEHRAVNLAWRSH